MSLFTRIKFWAIQQANSGSILLGRRSGSAGDFEEITLGTNLSMNGSTLNATGGGSPTGSFTGSFTGSVLGTSSYATNALTASYALNTPSTPANTSITASQLTTWQTNYNPTEWNSTVEKIIVSSNNTFPFILGLQATQEGHLVEFINSGNNCFGFKHSSSAASSSNQFDFSFNGLNEQDLICYPQSSIKLLYSGSKWRSAGGGLIKDVPDNLGHYNWDDCWVRNTGEGGWQASINTGGTLSEFLTADVSSSLRTGITQYSTGTSTTGNVIKSTNSIAGQYAPSTSSYYEFTWIGQWPTQSSDVTNDWRIANFGFSNSPTGTATSSYILRYIYSQNSGNWQLFVNNVLTVNTSTPPVFGDWSRIRIVGYPISASVNQVEAWQNGVLMAEGTGSITRPCGANLYFFKIAGTDARIILTDYISGAQIKPTKIV